MHACRVHAECMQSGVKRWSKLTAVTAVTAEAETRIRSQTMCTAIARSWSAGWLNAGHVHKPVTTRILMRSVFP